LPNKDHPTAFPHPCDHNKLVFIGGEMPHWAKKFVNRLERTSSSKNNVSLTFRDQPLSLDMIKDAWLWDDEGFSAVRKTVLTEDHFYKNAYSRMRVHLAVQVLSTSVVQLIERYVKDPLIQAQHNGDSEKLYAPLKTLISSCDRLVDICNANGKKECEYIDSPDHFHIKELRDILQLFHEWKESCKSKDEFITKESYEDLCWLVYGLEGVAKEYLKQDKSRRMMQRRGGSDCCENEFASFRQANCNPTEFDLRTIEARRAAFRGHDVSSFSRIVKSNGGRENRVDLVSLSAKLIKKRKREDTI
jgi:hypothetical protein